MRHASVLFLLTTLAASASAAVEPGLPTNVCYDNFCGPRQEKIWNRFQLSSGLDRELSPGLYSGVCFHNTPLLDGSRVHYGGIMIDKANGRLFFDGRFSFFTDNNPYLHMSMAGARQRFHQLFEPSHALEIKNTFAFIEFEDRLVPRRFWLRRDGVRNRLVLVGYFGPLHTILCELKRND